MGSLSSQLSRLRKLSTANSIVQEKGEHQELKKTTLRGVGTGELKQADIGIAMRHHVPHLQTFKCTCLFQSSCSFLSTVCWSLTSPQVFESTQLHLTG